MRHSWLLLPLCFLSLACLLAPAASRLERLPGARPGIPAAGLPAAVMVQDAAGRRSGPIAPSGTGAAVVVELPATWAGHSVELLVWDAGGQRGEPVLRARPKVRADGALPIAGLLPGGYRLEVRRSAAGEVLVAAVRLLPGSQARVAARPPAGSPPR